jgi:hypothetical protein
MSQYQQDEKNDYYLFLFYRSVIDYVTNDCILSDNGSALLLNMDLENELKTLAVQPNHQRTLVKVSLYLTIGYNLAKIFLGLIEIIEEGESEKYFKQKLPVGFITFVLSLKSRTVVLLNHIDAALLKFTSEMYERYAKVFNQEKRRLFKNDVYNTVLRIPSGVEDEEIRKAIEGGKSVVS